MMTFVSQSVFFGVLLTLITFEIGVVIKNKTKWTIANPLLISAILIIICLVTFHIDYEVYQQGAKYITYFLTPATVSLAIPLYRKLELLKKYPKAILGSVFLGVMMAMVSIFLMSFAFGISHEQYVTLLPKSVTTAIGMGVSEKLGGIVSITVVAICITGNLGNIFAKDVLKVCKITNPIAKGLAIGTSAHAMGTSKAVELGEIEGAMSSLAIVVAGIMTVVTASFFAKLM